jgi:hypothetical protein
MIPIFEGHNDAVTRADHALLAQGRPEGDLDLPRMARAGVRGAIFAVFTESEPERHDPVPRQDGVIEFEYSDPVPQPVPAGHATAALGGESDRPA